MVPLMIGLLAMTQHRAHGTSLGGIILIALAAFVPYCLRGHVDWLLAVQLAAGSVVGVVLGAKVMTRVPAPLLRRLFGVFLVAISLRMLLGTIW